MIFLYDYDSILHSYFFDCITGSVLAVNIAIFDAFIIHILGLN